MTKIGPRTYRISGNHKPIVIRIEAKHLKEFQAVVSDILVTRAGRDVERLSVTLRPAGGPLVQEFTVPWPRRQPPLELNVTVHGFFATATGAQPAYELTLTPANGDPQQTRISKPTVDPGVANLTLALL